MEIKILPLGDIQANCYIVTDDDGAAVIIDPGAPDPELARIAASLNVKYILLTHGHFDHIMGAAMVKRITDAKVLIHRLDAPKLTDETLSLCYRHYPGAQEFVEPDILIGDGDIIGFGGGITVYHTPGHTAGSVCFRMGRVLFTGDTLFCRTVGRTDFPDGSMADMICSVDRLQALDGDFDIFPGHNRPTTMAQERLHNRYFRKKRSFLNADT